MSYSLVQVDDPDDPRLAVFRFSERKLSPRPQRRNDDGAGLFMAEGDLVVERALDAGCVPVAALIDATRPLAALPRLQQQIDVFCAGDSLRALVTGLGMPLSAVAIFHRPPRPSVQSLTALAHRLVIVEGVDNPVNVGSIVRNAAGLGWDAMLLDQTSADPLARRSLRVSMGHALRLPHAKTASLPDELARLVADGWMVAALTPTHNAVDIDTVTAADRTAIVVGSERAGLSADVLAMTTHRLRIPMHVGVDSLNAAAATAIACFALGAARPTC